MSETETETDDDEFKIVGDVVENNPETGEEVERELTVRVGDNNHRNVSFTYDMDRRVYRLERYATSEMFSTSFTQRDVDVLEHTSKYLQRTRDADVELFVGEEDDA